MKSLTKKITLAIGIVGTLFLGLLVVLGTDWCYLEGSCRELRSALSDDRWIFTIIFPFILLFSLITFWMNEVVFQRWFRFTLWYVPLFVIAIFVFPTDYPGGFGPGPGYHEAFNILILIALFLTYIITSILKIVRARRNVVS